jgi:hypothetical protein
MKKLIFLLLLLSRFAHAGDTDSTYQRLVDEGSRELCRILEKNDAAVKAHRAEQMEFVVLLSGEDPVNYVSGVTVANHPPDAASGGVTKDSLNAKLRSIYQQYGIELYMVLISSLNVIIESPLPPNATVQQLFTQKLYDEQTNMAAMRQQHKSLTEAIISSSVTPRNRDCLIYSRATYCGSFFKDSKEGCWKFSKVYTHFAQPATYANIPYLGGDFTSRLKSNNDFVQGNDESSALAAAETFRESAAYFHLKSQLLQTFTPDGISDILRQFQLQDYESLTIPERRHILSVYAGYDMDGEWLLNGVGEEGRAIRTLKTTPAKDVEGVISFLAMPGSLENEPNYSGRKDGEALIVNLIRETDDAALGSDNNYTLLMSAITTMMTSNEAVFNDHLPHDDAGWHMRQIDWSDTPSIFQGPAKIGSIDFEVELLNDGRISATRQIVNAWEEHVVGQAATIQYEAVWATDTSFTLQPLDLVFFKNRSSLSMLEQAGAQQNGILVAPAIFLKYAADKEFNVTTVKNVAIALDIVAVAVGPGLIIQAVEAGNFAIAAFEAMQFLGSAANLTVNALNDPELQSVVDKYNMIVAAWGISRIAASVGKFSVKIFQECKAGGLHQLPPAAANDFRQSYALAEGRLSQLDDATQKQLRRMKEYLGEAGAALSNDIPYINGWTRESILINAKGLRPAPTNYLPNSYITSHLNRFKGGASYIVPRDVLDSYGRDILGWPDNSQFVMPISEMNQLLLKTGGNISEIEKELGIPAGSWNNKELVRIDVPNPSELNLRMPTGNEMGTNNLWIPGGKLPTGYSEAVINNIPAGKYQETIIQAQ